MPTQRGRDQAIKAGLHDVVDFTDDDIIRNFPLQSDMDLRFRWAAPDMRLAPGIPRVRVERSFSGHSRNLGTYFFDWGFGNFTLGMTTYWFTTFLPSGVPSAAITVRTYDRDGNPVYLQCILHEPADYPIQEGGYQNVLFSFTDGVIIT